MENVLSTMLLCGYVNLRTTVEVVGAMAIVGSLVFVGLQLKQSHEIAIATQYQDRATSAIEMFSGQLQSDAGLERQGMFARRILTGDGNAEIVESFTDTQLGADWIIFQTLLIIYDNNYFQYRAGYLDRESWLSFRNRMKKVLSVQINRAIYSGMAEDGLLRKEFADEVKLVLKEIDNAEG